MKGRAFIGFSGGDSSKLTFEPPFSPAELPQRFGRFFCAAIAKNYQGFFALPNVAAASRASDRSISDAYLWRNAPANLFNEVLLLPILPRAGVDTTGITVLFSTTNPLLDDSR